MQMVIAIVANANVKAVMAAVALAWIALAVKRKKVAHAGAKKVAKVVEVKVLAAAEAVGNNVRLGVIAEPF